MVSCWLRTALVVLNRVDSKNSADRTRTRLSKLTKPSDACFQSSALITERRLLAKSITHPSMSAYLHQILARGICSSAVEWSGSLSSVACSNVRSSIQTATLSSITAMQYDNRCRPLLAIRYAYGRVAWPALHIFCSSVSLTATERLASCKGSAVCCNDDACLRKTSRNRRSTMLSLRRLA